MLVGQLKSVIFVCEWSNACAQAVHEIPEWDELVYAVDSEASITMSGRDMLNKERARSAKPDVMYELQMDIRSITSA